MKVQIRQGVFETNSSSMHSLAICKDEIVNGVGEDPHETIEDINEKIDSYLVEVEDKPGKFILDLTKWEEDDWYYGRAPFQILDDFVGKFKYAFSNLYREDDKDIIPQFLTILQKINPNIVEFTLPNFCGVDDYMLPSWMDKYGFDLEEFLTNYKYVVIVDGDEYCIWQEMMQSGIINTKDIENIKEQNLW